MVNQNKKEGIIGWFVRNPVAANLLMFSIIGLGLYSGINLRKQTTPDFNINYVRIRYPKNLIKISTTKKIVIA